MAAVSDSSQLHEKFNSLQIKLENDSENVQNTDVGDVSEYGLPLEEVYKLALSFYKG